MINHSIDKKSAKITLLRPEHQRKFFKFLSSIDSNSLNTYTRWGYKIQPKIISKQIMDEIINGKEIAWICTINNLIVGYQHINFIPNSRKNIVRDGTIVLKKHTGHGFGQLLKNECIKFVKKNNFIKITAIVYEKNLSSLINNLNCGFLISGIFFNEEKINGISRYAVSMEIPISKKIHQKYFIEKIHYFKKIKYSELKIKQKNNFENNSIPTFLQKMNKSKIIINSKVQKIFIKKLNKKSKIVFIKDSFHIETFGIIEMFSNPNKKHVARIHIFSKIKSLKNYYTILSEIIRLGGKLKLEKIWINVLENNSELIKVLISSKFQIESIAFQHKMSNSVAIDILSFAYYFDNPAVFDVEKTIKTLLPLKNKIRFTMH